MRTARSRGGLARYSRNVGSARKAQALSTSPHRDIARFGSDQEWCRISRPPVRSRLNGNAQRVPSFTQSRQRPVASGLTTLRKVTHSKYRRSNSPQSYSHFAILAILDKSP